ncbi:glutamine amidotransferase class-I (plasmid) [Sulfuricurvum kujiense DSM 16994]|uniref:Glutamine amidotransferase class-I n=1 Tax=Sulfuricurvum kujiense (strain ATCC BAA-921 / DSM 16994 / JCM 11577 / YK-1) TaxID=709032 RepID=E4U3Q5_SULKY|nr:GMP synthase [Sulfuricurvum kujiense]ADR35321.1 glutamine amidotransferase class-I [Sulfuricurvum kujiense DSM 16994]
MTIWQHVPFENEAAIGEWARMKGITYRIIRCWENEPLEADDLLVVLGGSMSAYDDIGFIKNEIEFLRKRIESGGKIFGICLGAQLLASAMGSRVYSSGTREAGWRSIDLMPHPLTDSLDKTQCVFHWHGDTFDLPNDTVRIARNDAFENQAFATVDGRIIATQFHFETTAESMGKLLDADGEYLQSDSVFVADTDTIQSEAHHIPTANKTLFELLDRWNQTLS